MPRQSVEAQSAFVAWAARPLASGAAFSFIERRCHSSVEVGCPSSGGQRTVGGGSRRLLASSVTSLRSLLPAKRVMDFSQASLASVISVRSVAGPCQAEVIAIGRRWREQLRRPGLTSEYQMPEVSICRRRAEWRQIQAVVRQAAVRSGHLLAQPRWPNCSVKGTPCAKAQAAPYLGR